MSKHPGGRPSVVTEEVLSKLEHEFSYGQTDEYACFAAGISTSALYRYIDDHPEFGEKKEQLKNQPKALGKKVVVDAIKDGDKNSAYWYLERKDPEFVKKSENKNDTNLKVEGLTLDKALEMDVEELQKIAKGE